MYTTATKHGLAGAFRVLPNENQREFDELIAEYHRNFAPTSTHEQFLVEEMAQSRWRLARVRRLKTAVIEHMVAAAGASDADSVLASAFIGNTAGAFKTLQSYAAAEERSYYRALKHLQAGRKEDLQNEPNSDAAQVVQPSGNTRDRLPFGDNHHLHVASEADNSLDEVAAEQRTPVSLPRPR
jgi:hypothetical protein